MSEPSVVKIALTGRLRSGKDSAADHLLISHSFGAVAFGYELKRQFHELLPWVLEIPKPREGYQRFGQVMRQEFGEDIWIRHAELMVEGAISWRTRAGYEKVGVVITDLRQPNEYAWAKANGFTIIRVTAPEELRLARAKAAGDSFNEADLAHDTEQHVDGFAVDYEIINDGTLNDLRAKVDAVLTKNEEEK